MYDDQLVRAINYRFAPDIASALTFIPTEEMPYTRNRVELPMLANVAVIHEKNLAAFGLIGRVHSKGEVFSDYRLFSTKDFTNTRDAAKVMEYFFDEAKVRFVQALVDRELKELGI